MKKLVFALVYFALLLGASYGSYVWGWYEGLNYHAVVSTLAEARVSLSAAESLRDRDPVLALELLEANIEWMHSSLLIDEHVPDEELGNFEIVKRRLEAYQRAYGVPGAR